MSSKLPKINTSYQSKLENSLEELEKPELPLIHRTLIQWEENAEKYNLSPYEYIYSYNEEEERAEVIISSPLTGYKAEIQYTFGRTLPYKFIVDDKEVFVCDKLRDIIKWIKNKEDENEDK